MGDGNVYRVVLQVGFAVVVVAQVHFLVKEGVQEGTHGQPLFAQGFAADERDFFHLVRGGGGQLDQRLLRFGDLPHADGGFVLEFLL